MKKTFKKSHVAIQVFSKISKMEQDEDEWQTVVSKNTIKKEKHKLYRQRVENFRKNRDTRYLQTHIGFQKHRLTRENILKLVEEKKPEGSLFIVSNGRCVGHLIAVNFDRQLCLQCYWSATDGFVSHCCCVEKVISSLPPNFYLGCDGYLNDYLVAMREKPIE